MYSSYKSSIRQSVFISPRCISNHWPFTSYTTFLSPSHFFPSTISPMNQDWAAAQVTIKILPSNLSGWNLYSSPVFAFLLHTTKFLHCRLSNSLGRFLFFLARIQRSTQEGGWTKPIRPNTHISTNRTLRDSCEMDVWISLGSMIAIGSWWFLCCGFIGDTVRVLVGCSLLFCSFGDKSWLRVDLVSTKVFSTTGDADFLGWFGVG